MSRYVGRSVFFGQVMSPQHSDHMSQGSQVSQSALWLCFSKVSLSECVSDEATYRAVPLFSEGQLKISLSVMVAELESQTCHPPNSHFGCGPFSTVGFVSKVKLYLRKQLSRFLPNSHFGCRPFSTVGFVPKV